MDHFSNPGLFQDTSPLSEAKHLLIFFNKTEMQEKEKALAVRG
jgi:hypothetical protein